MNDTKITSSMSVRRRMSVLTAAMRRRRSRSKTRAPSRQPGRASASRQSQKPEREAGPFGDERRQRHALHTPAEPEDEPGRQRHVHPVGPDLHREYPPAGSREARPPTRAPSSPGPQVGRERPLLVGAPPPRAPTPSPPPCPEAPGEPGKPKPPHRAGPPATPEASKRPAPARPARLAWPGRRVDSSSGPPCPSGGTRRSSRPRSARASRDPPRRWERLRPIGRSPRYRRSRRGGTVAFDSTIGTAMASTRRLVIGPRTSASIIRQRRVGRHQEMTGGSARRGGRWLSCQASTWTLA